MSSQPQPCCACPLSRHVSLTTTNVYAEVDLEMKAKALANCEVVAEKDGAPWKEDKGLMEFLRNL
jgi:integrase/recombinase XerD